MRCAHAELRGSFIPGTSMGVPKQLGRFTAYTPKIGGRVRPSRSLPGGRQSAVNNGRRFFSIGNLPPCAEAGRLFLLRRRGDHASASVAFTLSPSDSTLARLFPLRSPVMAAANASARVQRTAISPVRAGNGHYGQAARAQREGIAGSAGRSRGRCAGEGVLCSHGSGRHERPERANTPLAQLRQRPVPRPWTRRYGRFPRGSYASGASVAARNG